MGRTTKLSLIGLMGALLVWMLDIGSCGPAKKPGDGVLVNRVWADRVPRNQRDMVLNLALIAKAKRRVGAVVRHSSWRLVADLLRFDADARTLTITSLQDQTSVRFGYRTWRCKNEAPKGYDLCLELTRGGRKLRMYSKSKEAFSEDQSVEDVLEEFNLSGMVPSSDADAACAGCETREPAWFTDRASAP